MDNLPPDLVAKARDVMEACKEAGTSVATAESCTGGLVGAVLTAIPGSSSWVERGFITYSNQAKTDMLGVATELIDRNGVVSEQVARAMAEGAVTHSLADVGVAITGIAGPAGGSLEKPVGTVHIAAARKDRQTLHKRLLLSGDRDQVRHAAAIAAMQLLIDRIQD